MTRLVTDPAELDDIVARLASMSRLALDAEGNGMHAFRARLCTLQLAWQEHGAVETVVVDTLAIDPAPLGALLEKTGPLKVLHDLTFDARMLADCGIALGNVHDTSVVARFLDESSTGLSALSERHLGVALEKGLQHHDWAQRPLEEAHLAYLAGDVRHLLDLADVLHRRVEALGISSEVALENEYKLETSLAPPSGPPDYVKAKGYRDLSLVARAVLRRLFSARDALAAAADVPAHKIAPTGMLLAIAHRRPRRADDIRRLCRGPAGRHLDRWLEAVAQGEKDGAPPAEEQPIDPRPPSRELMARRRALERALASWRKSEAEHRNVSVQVVVPGHCMGPLVSALCGEAASDDDLAAIPGLGEMRVARYGAIWRALLDT